MPKEKKRSEKKKKPESGLDALVAAPLKALDDLIFGKAFDGPKKKKSDDDEEPAEEVSDEADDGDDEEDEDDDDDEQPKRKPAAERPAFDININHVFAGREKPAGGKRSRKPDPDPAEPPEENGEAEGE